MNEGYVRLHRRLLEWEWFGDSTTVHVLMFILLRVNWQRKVWQGHTIEPGQMITSRASIAEACGLSEKQVRLALDKLNRAGVITTDRAGLGQRVTLQNWAEYQSEPVEKGRKRAALRAEEGPIEGRSRAVTEEGKNQKKQRIQEPPQREDAQPELMVWPVWAGPKVMEGWETFKAYKKATHRFQYKTRQSEQAAINELAKMYSGGKACFEGLQEAMAKGWKFPVNHQAQGPQTTRLTNGTHRPTQTEQLLADIRAGKYGDPDELSGATSEEAHGAPHPPGHADLFDSAGRPVAPGSGY